jgi:hypothetical protein
MRSSLNVWSNFTMRWLNGGRFLHPRHNLGLLLIARRTKRRPQVSLDRKAPYPRSRHRQNTHVCCPLALNGVPLMVVRQVEIQPIFKILGFSNIKRFPRIGFGTTKNIDPRVRGECSPELTQFRSVHHATYTSPVHDNHRRTCPCDFLTEIALVACQLWRKSLCWGLGRTTTTTAGSAESRSNRQRH